MIEYRDKLNYSIKNENYVKDIEEILMKKEGQQITVSRGEDGKSKLTTMIGKVINNRSVSIEIEVIYDTNMLYDIGVKLFQEDDDNYNYEMELKLFYFEEIKVLILDQININSSKYTIRNYRAIYNAYPIVGAYTINGEYKIKFHTLDCVEKHEPLTEHIICFDIELKERNIERARSKAYNVISDFCSYLSVLLDIGFYDIQSKFINFVRTNMNGWQKEFVQERYRTAFYDKELDLFVKDNMNGLCPKKELERGISEGGYFSIYLRNQVSHFKIGELDAVNDTFKRHRLYKVKDQKNTEQCEDILLECHFPYQKILVPKKIRNYYQGIDKLKKENKEKYICFRNAARLYNKSHFLSISEASMEISFLVASVEALAKCEKKPFTNFVNDYCDNVDKKELDLMYSVRSKLFHAGEFSFFEFDFELNPYSNPLFIEFHDYYMHFKNVLRKAIISWVNSNVLNE